MSDYLPALQTELYAVIGTACPTIVVPSGTGNRPTLFTTLQALTISIVEFAKDAIEGASGRPVPPYMFVDLGRGKSEPGYSITCDVQRMVPAIYLVDCHYSGHEPDQQSLSSVLWALKRAIDDNSHTTFQPVQYGAVDSSPTNPVTKALASQSKVDLVAAMLSWPDGWLVNFG